MFTCGTGQAIITDTDMTPVQVSPGVNKNQACLLEFRSLLVWGYLTPLIPPSYLREGEGFWKGAKHLSKIAPLPDRFPVLLWGCLRGALAPHLVICPFPC
jgi:hypothetical protein